MRVQATAKYIRIAPRKTRLVVDAIRGLDVTEAVNRLAVINKRASAPISKVLNSCIANAEHNLSCKKENLFISEIRIDDGPAFSRWMPKAFGRATPLLKKTSHIRVVLEEKIPSDAHKGATKPDIKTAKETKRNSDKKVEADMDETKKKFIDKEMLDSEKELPFDVRMKGKHRNAQNQNSKKEKGVFKKMFQRKSGM
jgi:large subunit ribosomal protein L22